MAKKMEDAEIKKECPSCGLGVALDATICEFCGWDFEEEDEWILQIEKLERELMLEKQKFEPGSVNHMIESTLRTPAFERVEPSQQIETGPPIVERAQEAKGRRKPPQEVPEEKRSRPTAPPMPQPSTAPASPAPGTKVRRVRSVKTAPPAAAPEKPVKRVEGPPAKPKGLLGGLFSVEGAQAPVPEEKSKKVRAVRKVDK